MKKMMGSIAAAVIYLILMCFLLGEDVIRLFDAGLFGMLLLGSLILCLPHMESRRNLKQMKGIFPRNILMTGYIETFMLLFVSLQSGGGADKGFLPRVALDFRPLFYGFVCCLLSGRGTDEKRKEESQETEDGQIKEQTGKEETPKEAKPEKKDAARDFSLLSRRERQVAELIRRGLSNREIGEELYISEATVKKHVSHIFEKLGIESRKDLK